MLPHPTWTSPQQRRRPCARRWALLLAACMACAVLHASAADYTQRQMLSAIASGDGEPNGLFGLSVAINGDLAAVSNFASATRPARVRTYARNGSSWAYLPDQDIELPGDSDVLMSFHDSTLLVVTYQSAPLPSRSYVQIYWYTGAGWELQYGFSTTASYFDSVATVENIAVLGESSYDGAAGANQGRIRVLRRTSGDNWDSEFIEPTTPEAGARFGQSVAIVAGAIVVGAPRETATYADAGAAYVYELTIDTWDEVARLVETDGGDHTDNRFGTAVAISGADISTPDRMLVSSPSNATTGRAGRVHSYTRTSGTWTPRSVVTAPSLSATDGFGCSLALDDIWAVIGQCLSDAAGTGAGAVVLARFTSGFSDVVSVTVRTDPQAAEGEYLGSRVDVDRNGPTVIVGNPVAPLYGNTAHGVVLFGSVESGDPFLLSRQLQLGQGLTNAAAGAFTIDGDTLLVAAYQEDIGLQQDRGAVYEYRRMPSGQYAFQSRILAPDGMAGDLFGLHMALKGDTVLISSIGYTLGGVEQAGAVYAFHRDAGVWSLEAQFLPVAPDYENEFGESLAFDGTTAMISNRHDSTFVYERSGAGTWTPVQTIAHVGWPLSLSGDVATLSDAFVASDDIGEVAIYQRVAGVWQPQATLTGTEIDQGFGFGTSLSGDLLAVASISVAAPVLLYRHGANGWLPEASVLPDDATPDTYCWHVSVTGPRLAIGCNGAGITGVVYVFEKIGGLWTQTQKIVLDDALAGDGFGYNLGLHTDGSLIIGAPWRDIDFIDQGAVYVYAGDLLFRSGFE